MTGALTNANGELLRRPLVARVMQHRGDALVVTGLGAPTYDVAAASEDPRTFHFWGAMGLAATTGLGLALAVPDARVLVVTGDGEMMMGIGSLATIANVAPDNLSILVLDNQSFGETGEQPSLTAGPADIAAIARGAGVPQVQHVTVEGQVDAMIDSLYGMPGPVLCAAQVARGEDPKVLPEWHGPRQVASFRRALLNRDIAKA